jgi:hypothetical protein
MLSASITYAQDCGPNCPICSGSGFDTEAMLSNKTVFTNARLFPDAEETLIGGMKLAVSSRLDLGLNYLTTSRKVLWNARALLVVEEDWKPAIILGIGSVRANTSDQSIFLTATRNLESTVGVPLRLSVGAAAYLSESDRVYPIGTLSHLYKEKLFPFISYDGVNFNYGAAYFVLETLHIGLIYAENRYLGLTTGFRFAR